jgi:dihydropteroate synthase
MVSSDGLAAGLSRAPTRHVRGLPDLGRCAVLGVVNVTPDSFSDGGEFYAADAAVRHGLELLSLGVDMIDVGGESTRPGAPRVEPAEEMRRVLPVVRELAAAGAIVSIDTMRAEVAERALDAGARVVNDVSGGLADPAMAPMVAAAAVPYVLMHWRGHSIDMNRRATYENVVAEVTAELAERLARVVDAGVDPERIIIDPGLGFAKRWDHNWDLLRHLDALFALGRPVLIAASRKRFLQRLVADGHAGEPPPAPRDADAATTALSALVAAAGAWAVRVHDARSSVDAVRVAAALAGTE